MTRRLITLTALLALSVAPAHAGLVDERIVEHDEPMRLVARDAEPAGYGRLTTSEASGDLEATVLESIAIVRYPDDERPKFDRGRD